MSFGSGGWKTVRVGIVPFPFRCRDVGEWDFFPAFTLFGMRSRRNNKKCVMEKPLSAAARASQGAVLSLASFLSVLNTHKLFWALG